MLRSPDTEEVEILKPAPTYRPIDLPPVKQDAMEAYGACPDDALAEVLHPMLTRGVMRALKQHPEVVIDIVYPVLGRTIRKAIAEAMRSLLVSIESTASHAFSLQRLRWRWEALRTKRRYAEVVLAHTLVFSVEELLLIHRDTGLLLHHLSKKEGTEGNRDLVSAMLVAIEDFARDSFDLDDSEHLSRFSFGNQEVLIKASPHALLAAAVMGTPTMDLHEMLDDALMAIHERFLLQLKNFHGDGTSLAACRELLDPCLISRTLK